jgi:hypothetical protein
MSDAMPRYCRAPAGRTARIRERTQQWPGRPSGQAEGASGTHGPQRAPQERSGSRSAESQGSVNTRRHQDVLSAIAVDRPTARRSATRGEPAFRPQRPAALGRSGRWKWECSLSVGPSRRWPHW